MTTYQRFVALGDSQTEGLLDPDRRGGYRGWADRFAAIVASSNPHLQYANLAVRGRLLAAIQAEQLGPACALRPDLATVMGGMNDVLRPGFDAGKAVGHVDAMVSELRAAGATVLTNTLPDVAALAPALRRLAPRVTAFNAAIREVAAARGAIVVDFAERGVGTDPRLWSPDRIHANPQGHALIAAAFADALGLPGHDGWADPLPPADPMPRRRRAAVETRWLAGTVVPWLVRRARGRSSGDGMVAKRPRLLPVASVFHIVAPDRWPASGEYRPPSLATEGFVHLSFADQVGGVANNLYRDAPELVVVELDPLALSADVRIEDSYGSGTEFPHVYGPVPVSAAIAVHPLRRGPDGGWVFTARTGAAAPASPDR